MDSTLRIHRVGEHIIKVFPQDTYLIGRPLDEVFRLIRPDIHVEWDKVILILYFLIIVANDMCVLDSILWSTYCISDGESFRTS